MADRRSLLRGLAVLPAIGFPSVALAAASPSPDAAIVTLAAHVKALAEREQRLHLRAIDLEDRAFIATGRKMPPRPETSRPESRELSGLMLQDVSCGMLGMPFDPAAAKRLALLKEEFERLDEAHKPVIAAWEQRYEELKNPPAARAARRLHRRALGKLIAAANDLGEMRPASLEGLIAKAGAVRLNREGYPDDDWAEYLVAFIVEDLRVMGGTTP